MATLKNNTARFYYVNGIALVPGRTVTTSMTLADIKEYPSFYSAVQAGLIEFTEDIATVVVDEVPHMDFDTMTLAELKHYAHDKGIDLGDATKKYDILAIVKNA